MGLMTSALVVCIASGINVFSNLRVKHEFSDWLSTNLSDGTSLLALFSAPILKV